MGPYFFCGIGGSGMLPLAMILHGQGVKIAGSDRSNDQGLSPNKFDWLHKQGISIVPQDGHGLTHEFKALIVSSAIEDSIPEVKKAQDMGIPILKRAELLAMLFNQAKTRIAIAGTSGKSTTTGMVAWILSEENKNPTVMNGANFLNFVSPDMPFASALIGDRNLFISECDESDGSIILYHPTIAVLNNIELDHKPVEELIPIFRQYLDQSEKYVLNLDNHAIAHHFSHCQDKALTYAINNPTARLQASDYSPHHDGSTSTIIDKKTGQEGTLTLHVCGKHNLENALSSLAVSLLLGGDFHRSLKALTRFKGISRRFQNIGKFNNINVIDDFAHNPDKIKATLNTLNEQKGRLLVIFQMHGFGPLRLMKNELANAFIEGLKAEDRLYMPEALYLGGTVDRSYTAHDFINEIKSRGGQKGIKGEWFPARQDIISRVVATARPNDRIIIMGARDDTLTEFAQKILTELKGKTG